MLLWMLLNHHFWCISSLKWNEQIWELYMKAVLWLPESLIVQVGCWVFWTSLSRTRSFMFSHILFLLCIHEQNIYFAWKPWFILQLHSLKQFVLEIRVTFKMQLPALFYCAIALYNCNHPSFFIWNSFAGALLKYFFCGCWRKCFIFLHFVTSSAYFLEEREPGLFMWELSERAFKLMILQ